MRFRRKHLLSAAALSAIIGGALLVDQRRQRTIQYFASASHSRSFPSNAKRNTFPPQPQEGQPRLIVIGGGIAGLSVAYFAKKLRPQASVILIEADSVAGAASSHNAGTIGLAQDFDTVKNKLFKPDWQDILAHLSVQAYKALERELNLDCEIIESGALLIAATEKEREYVEDQHAQYVAKGFDKVELVTSFARLRELEPALRECVVAALHYPGSISIDPRKASLSMAQAAMDLGVEIVEGDACVKLAEGRDWSIVLRSGKVLLADFVVIANGAPMPHTPALLGETLVVPVKGQIVQFPPAAQQTQQVELQKMIFSASAYTAFASRVVESIPPQCTMDSSIRHLYGRQKKSGELLFGGSRIPVRGRPNYQPDARVTSAIASHAKEVIRFPDMAESKDVDAWACFMPFSVDGKPFVGRVDGVPRLFLSLGFGVSRLARCPPLPRGKCTLTRHYMVQPEGMTQAPGAGLLLAREIWGMANEDSKLVLGALTPNRKRRKITLA